MMLNCNFLKRAALPILASVVLTGCSGISTTLDQAEFVSVQNLHLKLEGEDYTFVGANFWYGGYLGADGEIGDPERLVRELDQLQALGINNLRILGASEQSVLKDSLSPGMQSSSGVNREDIFRGLDLLLDEMAKRDMKAVIYLNNFWEWSGGMATYLHWETNEIVDPSDPEHPWPAYAKFTSKFYSNQKANNRFKAYIETLVTRVNTMSGIAYKDDPTIMAWQLANEPRPGFPDAQGHATLPVFYEWIDDTAGYIKSLDSNHLVSTGNEGRVGCIELPRCYIAAHESGNIDYLTFHMWPKNWGWIDANDMAGTYPQTLEKAQAYIDEHVNYARILNKPLILEEFGMERDSGHIGPKTSTVYRDKFYGYIFKQIESSVAKGGPFIGSNFWSWGGEGRSMSPNGDWVSGSNSYTGDPPQEPQGLNSIFDTDESTHRVIENHVLMLDDAAR